MVLFEQCYCKLSISNNLLLSQPNNWGLITSLQNPIRLTRGDLSGA